MTREVAERLAELASALEARGYPHERVARFLMRVVFTLFAEDVGLLPGEPFRKAIEEIGFHAPGEFADALRLLWEAMDRGGPFGYHRLLRFNGHFFRDCDVIPLEPADIRILHRASVADWADVEPAIFGTLLVRALDPAERHRLGAEFTPRAYVERVVRPTIEEPVRQRWTLVQAEVLQLRERIEAATSPRTRQELTAKALDRLHAFHRWLRSLRILDPACGSGNFLYVALDTLKRIELEVFREIEQITGQHEVQIEEVNPSQFHGIEVKLWARELAELTLWIGYHQWWKRTHGTARPPEPVLQDTGTIEHRDAVLAWDDVVEDPARARPDPTPRIPHPVTGELVPDPDAKLPYYDYRGARQAPWPHADFIVGNPPYMGKSLMRDEFGDGYVDALRSAYPDVPDGADYVMYWWYRAAQAVAAGITLRAGLITTNSIRQPINRQVVEQAQREGVSLAWVIPSHPWVDDAGAANVTVAMTVLAPESSAAVLVEVDEAGRVVRESRVPKLNADLSAHADVATAAKTRLTANAGLAANGLIVYGRGFVLDPDEAHRLLDVDPRHSEIIRPLRNGRDLNARPRGLFVIDFGLREEEEAKQYPVLYDIVRTRVKPYRDTVRDRARREAWWRFGKTNEYLRAALLGLRQFIGTSYVSRHRIFTFLSGEIAAEDTVVCIGSSDAFHLGVLSIEDSRCVGARHRWPTRRRERSALQ